MAIVYWVGPGPRGSDRESGDFATASNWSNGATPGDSSDVYLSGGSYVVTSTVLVGLHSLSIGSGVTLHVAGHDDVQYGFALAADSVNSGTLYLTGSYVTVGTTFLNLGQVIGLNTGYVSAFYNGTFVNAGLVTNYDNGVGGYFLFEGGETVQNDAGGVFRSGPGGYLLFAGTTTNDGLIVADRGLVTFQGYEQTGSLANLADHVLTGGSWSAVGAGGTIDLRGTAIQSLAAGTTVQLSGAGSVFEVDEGSGDAAVTLETSLNNVQGGATLAVLDGRDYTAASADLEVDGTLLLGGGTVLTGYLSGNGGSLVAGYGVVAAPASFAGEIRADGNPLDHSATLDFSGGVDIYGTLTGMGTLELSGGSVYLAPGHAAVAHLLLDGAQVALGANLSYSHILMVASGLLDLGTSRLQLTGHLGFGGGVIDGEAGSLLNLKGASLTSEGFGLIEADVQNNGTVTVKHGTLTVDSTVHGTGGFVIDRGATLDFGNASHVAATQSVTFAGPKASLELFDAPAFHGSLVSFGDKDSIDLAGLAFTGAHSSYREDKEGTGGTLRVTSTSGTVSLHFEGTYHKLDFILSDDGSGGTKVRFADHPDALQLHTAFGGEQTADIHGAWDQHLSPEFESLQPASHLLQLV